jgi:hypothetical protein
MKKGILALIVLTFALALAAPVFAEDTAQEKTETKGPFRKELVQLKYLRSGGALSNFIQTYLSREGRTTGGPTDRVIVISDYPENVEKALQAIRQIDVKPADLQFTVQLILGSEEPEKGSEAIPNDPVMRELRNLLKYKSYSLLDTSIVRAMDDENSEVRLGEKAEFELQLRPKVIRDEKSSLIQTGVRLIQIVPATSTFTPTSGNAPTVSNTVGEQRKILISTTLNLKSGDKTVVGVSKLDGGDKGLILIISGKIVD